MSDPSANDPLLRALAYAHPLWMVTGIAAAVLALRSGLGLRRSRRRADFDPGQRERHLRRAKFALLWIVFGFVGGPLSMFWLRGRAVFESAHGYVALVALALFVVTGVLGLRLERGDPVSRDTHALVALLALLAAGLGAMTGFVLLP